MTMYLYINVNECSAELKNALVKELCLGAAPAPTMAPTPTSRPKAEGDPVSGTLKELNAALRAFKKEYDEKTAKEVLAEYTDETGSSTVMAKKIEPDFIGSAINALNNYESPGDADPDGDEMAELDEAFGKLGKRAQNKLLRDWEIKSFTEVSTFNDEDFAAISEELLGAE